MKENLFFKKKMFEDRQIRQMNEPNMFRKKKNPVGRITPPFFFESTESDVFSILYMIRIRFFGSGELIQKGFSAPQ